MSGENRIVAGQNLNRVAWTNSQNTLRIVVGPNLDGIYVDGDERGPARRRKLSNGEGVVVERRGEVDALGAVAWYKVTAHMHRSEQEALLEAFTELLLRAQGMP